jgi:hypothetical protein
MCMNMFCVRGAYRQCLDSLCCARQISAEVLLLSYPSLSPLLLLDPYRARFEELITCSQTAELNNAQRRVALAEMIVAVVH